jgi:tetratricopeptide (TPR) repeat protein
MADLIVRRDSTREAVRWLRRMYAAAGLSRRHRAKLAKRLADLARSEGDYEEAVIWYDEAAKLLPALRGEARYRIASCHEEAGDVAAAMEWYRQIEQPPWRVRGQLALAKLLEREERLEEARAIYQALMREPIPEAKVAEERFAALEAAGR